MNKLSKIFLTISIILAIILIVMICLYLNATSLNKQYLNSSQDSAEILLKTNEAIEKAGFEVQIQDDGSFKLVERINEIERTTE